MNPDATTQCLFCISRNAGIAYTNFFATGVTGVTHQVRSADSADASSRRPFDLQVARGQ
jgi:hypothetical protein